MSQILLVHIGDKTCFESFSTEGSLILLTTRKVEYVLAHCDHQPAIPYSVAQRRVGSWLTEALAAPQEIVLISPSLFTEMRQSGIAQNMRHKCILHIQQLRTKTRLCEPVSFVILVLEWRNNRKNFLSFKPDQVFSWQLRSEMMNCKNAERFECRLLATTHVRKSLLRKKLRNMV